MKSVYFGFGLHIGGDNESAPSVGLNRHGKVLMVHEVPNEKRYRVGNLNQATIDWKESRPFGHGKTPHVALNSNNIAVEVHRNDQHNTLYCGAGRLGGAGGDDVTWTDARRYGGEAATSRPAVALNDAGRVVEMHELLEAKKHWLYYTLGQVKEDGSKVYVEWSGRPDKHKEQAVMPAVAINNRDIVVEVHRDWVPKKALLWYRVGRVKGKGIEFGERKQIEWPEGGVAHGHHPSVAITDDGLVIVVCRAAGGKTVNHFTGEVGADGKTITWHSKARYHDDGYTPSVAAAGAMAVEVHVVDENKKTQVRFSTSIITDRAKWMEDRLDSLGKKRLGDLVLPASHDSGMYTPFPENVPHARNQNLTILQQLRYGIRYFDLRPMWATDETSGRWYIHHGGNAGPFLETVLNDIAQFAREGHRELVILQFSTFTGVNNNRYKNLVEQVDGKIGKWLVKSKPDNKRLAEITLGEYVKDGPAILVVVDKDFAVNNPKPGFWVYRERNALAPAKGHLCVFDQWSNTGDFAAMQHDQLEKKFAVYNGRTYRDDQPCDLFLLSWSLTPKFKYPFYTPRQLAPIPNRRLGGDIRLGSPNPEIPNKFGKIINLLSVDYVELARVTDVALFHNGEQDFVAAEAVPRKRRTAASASTSASATASIKANTPPRTKTSAKAKRSPKSRASTERT